MMNKANKTSSDEWLEAVIDEAVDQTDRPLPTNLRQKLIADGEDFLARRDPAPVTPRRKRQSLILPWSVAFASLAVCAVLVLKAPPETGVVDVVAAVAEQPALNWAALEAPGFSGVRGFVKWDNVKQRGYMQIEGIPANDPNVEQYQLWIVDPERDKHPVDGGVFNVTAGTNIIPIDSKLRVLEPRAFAVTLEKPGGVVVSDGPLLFVAST